MIYLSFKLYSGSHENMYISTAVEICEGGKYLLLVYCRSLVLKLNQRDLALRHLCMIK